MNKILFNLCLCDKVNILNIKINEINKKLEEQNKINKENINNIKELNDISKKQKKYNNKLDDKYKLNKEKKEIMSYILENILSNAFILFFILLLFIINIYKINKQNKNLTKTISNNYNILNDYALFNFISHSDIIKFKNIIMEGIKRNFNKNIKKFNLLYQASRDGYGSEDFHRKCDGKKNTVTLILSDKYKIFGGFTDAEWDKTTLTKKDIKDFFFL